MLLECRVCWKQWPASDRSSLLGQGLVDYLAGPDIAKVVDVGDAAGLREAIVHLLKNPQEAESQAQRGYEMVVNQHRSEPYVDVLAQKLRSL